MRRWASGGGLVLLLVSAVACSKDDPSVSTASSASAAPPAAPAFDVEGFCEATMGVGRACEGDDELMEGNKIGLCSTTLRAARDDEGVKLDVDEGRACREAVAAADPPLPDVRTLTTLAQRLSSCRELLSAVPSLQKVEAVAPGDAKAGEACRITGDCAHGLFCHEEKCAPKKKAGEPCRTGQECLGRCSRKEGKVCVSYCGVG